MNVEQVMSALISNDAAQMAEGILQASRFFEEYHQRLDDYRAALSDSAPQSSNAIFATENIERLVGVLEHLMFEAKISNELKSSVAWALGKQRSDRSCNILLKCLLLWQEDRDANLAYQIIIALEDLLINDKDIFQASVSTVARASEQLRELRRLLCATSDKLRGAVERLIMDLNV